MAYWLRYLDFFIFKQISVFVFLCKRDIYIFLLCVLSITFTALLNPYLIQIRGLWFCTKYIYMPIWIYIKLFYIWCCQVVLSRGSSGIPFAPGIMRELSYPISPLLLTFTLRNFQMTYDKCNPPVPPWPSNPNSAGLPIKSARDLSVRGSCCQALAK